eukprot:CAMPEP_0173389610 /NCGR_PEP_ID=MMETSP1356-20130122/12725_1 /TAXON_ID=77927 ORGANISM="Hemiselmis virescens, Strain PCC157" /NCGR_SAMPLE_ID=MMETSP1356 /ASSEMBLY_ACC=CAM_ASM_000847 /LENGTH=58 /DNA_ID=CAMNT_0014346819 /DNA_START=81 /DNA_END=254 /DNA_ORIENTATION=+
MRFEGTKAQSSAERGPPPLEEGGGARAPEVHDPKGQAHQRCRARHGVQGSPGHHFSVT